MLILKGIVIGLGKIIPGVSGSMLAISLGVYQELIESLNNIFKFSKLNIKFIIKVAIGILISIVFFSSIINKLLINYYSITMMFFIGLIIGGFGDIKGNINFQNKKIIFISFFLVLLLGIINLDNEITIKNSFLLSLYFLFIGIVDAFTTVVPGISGTATLMILGGYRILINSFSTMFNINYLKDNLLILTPFFIGFSLGIILTARLIHFLFNKYKSSTYCCILGFSLSTVILMLIKTIVSFNSLNSIILGLIFLLIGVLITKKISSILSS